MYGHTNLECFDNRHGPAYRPTNRPTISISMEGTETAKTNITIQQHGIDKGEIMALLDSGAETNVISHKAAEDLAIIIYGKVDKIGDLLISNGGKIKLTGKKEITNKLADNLQLEESQLVIKDH